MCGCGFISAYFGLQELGIKRDGVGGVEQDLALGVLAVHWEGSVQESTRRGMRPAAPRVSVGTTANPGNPLSPPPSVFKQEKKRGGKKTQQTKKPTRNPSFAA